jgi:acetyltransferase
LLVEKSKGQTKPILAAWMGQDIVNEGRDILKKSHIPCFETPEEATRTFTRMYEYRNGIDLLNEKCADAKLPNPDLEKIKDTLKKSFECGTMMLSEADSKGILEAYQIPTTLPKLAQNESDAAKLAKEIGFPVVMKIQSEDISHKSDANCVMLDIKTEEQAKAKFNEIIANAKKYNSKAKLDGVTVQKMASAIGHEVILGSKKDSLFGSVILFGMGGVAVEAIKDRNIGLPPLNRTLAKRLVEGTKVYKLLKKGYRNIPAANMDLVEEVMVRFSQLLIDLPEIKEIDINPLRIDDKNVIALDARMLLDADFFGKENPDRKHHIVC